MKVGFIGTGTMGSLLIEAFVTSGALEPSQIAVSNRTYTKALALASRFVGISAVPANAACAANSDIIFLCVKPLEFKKVVDELLPVIRPEQLVVSITSPVLIAHLEEMLPCKVAKVIPSVTNSVLSGATLCVYGSRLSAEDEARLEILLNRISKPLQIEEPYTRIVSDLSSCGPAFISCLMEQFVDAAVEETGISREEAGKVVASMLLGTGLLLTEGGLSLADVQAKVAVPGGITAQALQLLRRETDGVFNRLVRTTHAKFDEDVSKVSIAFYGEEVNGQ
ncbi:late competence protein ComER [Paenibacillus radicis (ex Gao et al. 2016)]|uniref:Pyrroline-5-carboxylate reductase n=1 Tax=Paenibacillus radicis (ex Gao et al. 2016) TaxID=1737354 RepID=A0A917LTJ1_9BACL|nr:late competence protein ComER [Paenibacillus radicis (ex Gao et al. 2016)]GGG55950.1 ComE operon protein 4 [Paenibacillus radicis (ex Gao et al. 2016)]